MKLPKRRISNPIELKPTVIWEPIAGTSQEIAIDSRANETLYHGTRGPGKTITQLMRFRRRVGIGYGSFWRGVIFDREYKNLADLVAQSKRFFKQFDDGAVWLSSATEYKWVWPTGEELLFRHAKKASDYDQFHGHEYPFIGWNELTKYPTSELYDMMLSTNRSSFTPEIHGPKDANGIVLQPYLPPIPLEVFSTTNPTGAGRNWVKARFIDVAPNGVVVSRETEVFNPKTQKDEIVKRTQIAIFGSYRENIYLDPKYVATLANDPDENRRKAWLNGDWSVTLGGAFDDVWKEHIHVLPRFQIPAGWRIDRAFDWGSSHPFGVIWWAEANGETAYFPDGTPFCPPAGSLIAIKEWYGTKEIGTNKGLKLPVVDIAHGIRDREIAMMQIGWIRTQPWAGPADNQIREVRESDVDTIEKKFLDEGIAWTESDKSPGSRVIGLQIVRDMLLNAVRGEGPGLYFTKGETPACIATIPSLPRDEKKIDDVDTTAEDHLYDVVRYRALRGANRFAESLNISFST